MFHFEMTDKYNKRKNKGIVNISSDCGIDDGEARLWIGNLDCRITEYHLIRVLQKYGKVTKFDFLFHKSGPLQGQPRGYCFVTYETRQEAKDALESLDGQMAHSKRLSVKWAHLKIKEDEEANRHATPIIPGLTPLPKTESEICLSTKIRAIEAKLKLMEENKDYDTTSLHKPYTRTIAPIIPHKKSTSIRQAKPYQKHDGFSRRFKKRY